MEKFLKFWGTRGSCPVSGPQYKRYGGNTCCLEVGYRDAHLIIDAGTGIRPLGEVLKRKKIDLFFGHLHWDHIIGLPFFEPLYRSDTHMVIWSSQGNERAPQEVFRSLFASELFPIHFEEIAAKIEFQTIDPKNLVSIGELKVDFHTAHHPGGALCFKIQTSHQTIGYVTDNELSSELDKSLIEFFSGCDLLIHEAQYSVEEYRAKTGWGHSSIANAAAFVEKIKVPEWLVIHHDPKHTDKALDHLAQEAKRLLHTCRVRWLADGEEVPLK